MSAAAYPWPDAAPGAFVLSVDVDGPIPHRWKGRTTGLRTAELEQRTYGPRRGIWRLLDVLTEADVTGTFFVPGAYAEENPDAVREIAARGHEVGLHGWMHEPPVDLTRDAFRDATVRSRDLLSELTGMQVRGFRSPSWDMTDDAFDVLRELGLAYDSSMMGDDRPYRLAGVTEIPVSWVLDDAPYLRYVGGATPGHPPHRPLDVARHWMDEIDAAARFGTAAVLTVHDWLSGRPAGSAALAEVLTHARNTGVWIATVAELAAWHDAQEGQA